MSDTREYIIDQAYSLFLSRSYEAVSISDISQAIGFTKGALYHHFTSKEELFMAVIDKYLIFTKISLDIENLTLLEFNDLCIKNVKKIIDNLFGRLPEFVPTSYMSIIIDAFRHYPGFAQETMSFFNSEKDKIKQILDNAIQRGEIRSDINTSVLAGIYFSSAMGLAGNLLQDNSIELTINTLKMQLDELYKLLKI